jgi:hypothetical protein
LENLGHLHKKTPYRLHEFDFEIMYKKGINMPADYLSRYTIAALNERTHQVDPSPGIASKRPRPNQSPVFSVK